MVLQASSQRKTGSLYELDGDVKITYLDLQMTAARITYDESTGEIQATGVVTFERPQVSQHLRASRAEYNLWTGTGTFYDVEGSFGAEIRQGESLLTSTNPFFFSAKRVDRIAEDTYRVENALITVCTLPDPAWTFSAPVAIIRPGESVRIYNSKFRLLDVPVFYSPYFRRSLKPNPRSSGFLMPTIGNSSRQGLRIGNSFYWAIHRSVDAEIGAEFLSKRGWAQRGTLRVRPSADSYLNVSYFGVEDRGFGPDRIDQGGQSVRAEGTAHLPSGFRGVLDLNLISSLTFREAFAQSFAEAVNSEVHSIAFLTRNFASYQLNAQFSRAENFQSIRPDDTVRIRRLPWVELNSVSRPMRPGAPFWLSWQGSAGLVSRSEPRIDAGSARLQTTDLDRYEVHPQISLPLHWKQFHLTTSAAYSATQYGAHRAGDLISGESLFRGTREFSVDLTLPSLGKTYAGAAALYSHPFAHVIEPRVTFRSVSGANRFDEILLFDERDLVSNTREIEYSLTNRVLVKSEGGQGMRETLSWELRQQYYFDPSFGNAVVPDQRNVFPSSLSLTSAAFISGQRRFSPIVSVLRFRPSGNYDIDFRQDYDPKTHRLTNGALVAGTRQGEFFASVSHFFVRNPSILSSSSNQIGFVTGYGNLVRNGFNAAFAGSYDFRAGFLQFSAVQVSYNSDCCGFSLEFRRFALGSVRNENQFRIAFSLANIGTFGNMKRQERLF
ncbi:MAG: hypothetical protein A3F68_05970 [Acidobacteria bacterium RIFCSPLOWO2_12_FULL_54_10]|nr:MAG: hypothetical protein A3F68_05970 [Acidobacteria bacterium RIFCSPLOWO2_12_FULL_54_10]